MSCAPLPLAAESTAGTSHSATGRTPRTPGGASLDKGGSKAAASASVLSLYPDPVLERITAAALQVRATQPERPGRILIAPLTDAELRVLKLLPTTGYVQMAATLYISRNTVKTHVRSIYQKLGASSRPEAIQRAVELRLL